MTNNMFSHASWLVLIALLHLPANGLAGTAAVFATTDNYNNVVATAITDAEYQMGGTHIAYATAKITSPDNRVTYTSDSDENTVSVNAMLSIDNDAGRYITENTDPREYCPVAMNMYFLQSDREDEIVAPFLKINSTVVTTTPILRQNGSSTYRANVVTSNGCSGQVTIAAAMTRIPVAIQATIQGQQAVAYRSITMSENSSSDFNFDVSTSAGNYTSGQLKVSPEVYGRPSACADRSLGAAKAPQTITVD